MRIAYVGSFQFPEGDASAARVLGIGRVLRGLGHDVEFYGIEKSHGVNWTTTFCSSHDGFKYVSPAPARPSVLGRIARQFSIITGSSVLSRLASAESKSSFDAVVAYQSPSALIFRLRSWCDARKIPLVCDTVEWYDRGHVPAGRYGPMALDSELRMRKAQPQADGIIAISRLLDSYYNERGMTTCRIPPLVDLSSPKWELPSYNQSRTRLTLAFVGNAGKKDLLVNAIRGLVLLGDAICRCTLMIVGPSKEELRAALGHESVILDERPDTFQFCGRLSHQAALRKLADADFSILLRQDARYAHAGFPTKLVESLSLGVPVIGNITGDVGDYFTESEGIILPDCSPEAFAAGVKRALLLGYDVKCEMRRCARERARAYFDYRCWTEPMGRFWDEILIATKRRFSL